MVEPEVPADMNMMIRTPRTIAASALCCAAALLCAMPAQAAPKKNKPATKPQAAVQPATGPAAHAQFPAFMQALDKMVAENSTDYYEPVKCAMEATEGNELEFADWMHAAAQKGNAAAIRWELNQTLASIRPENLLSPEVKSAYRELVKLADKQYVPAMLDVSACLHMGIGTEKNDEAALKKLVEACKGGDMKARFQWLLNTKRMSVWADKDKPEVASEISRGNHYVINHFASLAPDVKDQVEWMKDAAAKGNGDAYLTLSSLASKNHPKESMALLRMAAQQHHPEAFFLLGTALADSGAATPFQQQAGITPSAKDSLLFMKTAALLGNMNAVLALGVSYYDGSNNLPQDYKKAWFYYTIPAIAETPIAMNARGIMLMLGQGVEKDTTKGAALLEQSAKSYPGAIISQAWMLYKGIGAPADAKEAANLLQEAAAVGAPVAYVYLAYITAKGGEKLPADVSMAKRYVRLAELDMGENAQRLYDALIVNDWMIHP